jgi:hypothetical protein
MESSPAQQQPPQKVNVSRKAPSAAQAAGQPARSGLILFWERHGNRILLGLTFLALLYALIQYRRSAERRAMESSWDGLEAARRQVAQFRSLDIGRMPPDQIVAEAIGVEGRTMPTLDSIAADDGHPSVATQALVTRGDLYWTLANLPTLSTGPTTQPAPRPGKTTEEYLALAEGSYKRAIQLNGDPVSVNVARLGLAAIAENRGQWDEAKKIYDALTADANASQAIKTMATFRGRQLEELRRPLFTTPATQAVATTMPATAPTTR